MTEQIKAITDSVVFDLMIKLAVLCFVPWAVWATVEAFEAKSFRERGGRFSSEDGLRLQSDMYKAMTTMSESLDRRMDNLPPQEWRDKVSQMSGSLDMLRTYLFQIESEFTRDFIRKDELKNLVP